MHKSNHDGVKRQTKTYLINLRRLGYTLLVSIKESEHRMQKVKPQLKPGNMVHTTRKYGPNFIKLDRFLLPQSSFYMYYLYINITLSCFVSFLS